MKLTVKYDLRVDHKYTGKCCVLPESEHRYRIEHKYTGTCCDLPKDRHKVRDRRVKHVFTGNCCHHAEKYHIPKHIRDFSDITAQIEYWTEKG